MLPFLKPKQVAGLIISKRKSDGVGIAEQHTDGDEDNGLDLCSEAIMRAIKSGDSKAFSKALRDAFEILDSEPHKEGPHTNDESYDSMNEKAARESE